MDTCRDCIHHPDCYDSWGSTHLATCDDYAEGFTKTEPCNCPACRPELERRSDRLPVCHCFLTGQLCHRGDEERRDCERTEPCECCQYESNRSYNDAPCSDCRWRPLEPVTDNFTPKES
jgi:hypothetical protein